MEDPLGGWLPHAPDLKSDTTEHFMWIAGAKASSDTAHLAYVNGAWETEQGQGSNYLFCNGYELHLSGFDALEYAEESALYNLPFDTANRLTTCLLYTSPSPRD